MKIKLLIMLSLALYSFFSAQKEKSYQAFGNSFKLNNVLQPHNPLAYSYLNFDPSMDCPGTGKICVIEVPLTDVYFGGQFTGRPKVDINTNSMYDLYDDIEYALSDTIDGLSQHRRIIFEQQP